MKPAPWNTLGFGMILMPIAAGMLASLVFANCQRESEPQTSSETKVTADTAISTDSVPVRYQVRGIGLWD